jgi:hypothetical protein
MGALVAFVAGYYVGTRVGPEGLEQLRDAWQTIRESEEVQELLSGGIAVLGDLVSRVTAVVTEEMDSRRRALSPVA